MDKSTRNLIQKVTQDARRLLEVEFGQQMAGFFDILPNGTIASGPGKHLDATQRIVRQKIVTAIDHEKASGSSDSEAVAAYLREVSFTYLNRFVALKMLEARGLAQECVSRGEQSSGFTEFCGLAPGLAEVPDRGYRLYIESLFDEFSIEIRVLFDRQTPASLLWPRRMVLDELLSILNRDEIAHIWCEDETIGWVYQYFNSGEERKKMRDESAVPRNSRELAVRNQFFTPRYVVEFLTDNTLGRIWYEMRKGDTALNEECRYLVRRPKEVFLAPGEKAPAGTKNETDLSQEELIKKTVYIEHRPKRDPRDLRVIDIANGSAHFLLYAFDLLERIYEEAWEDHESPESEATGRTLREDFETLHDLHRAAPKLIIEHNLHGIDIDPRAVQIAALALWMRAQKTWKNLGIKTAERPRIVKSNIVTAEPMPGEEDMRREFTATLKPRVLGQLVDVVFDKMKLAGEAGSLLKIEEEIKDSIAEARKQWIKGPKPEQQSLFPDLADPRPKQQELRFDFDGVAHELFWEQAEDRILNALKDYAERAENGHAVRRRLFAEDAARGFAFIDLFRKQYDVVLMNPPFGDMADRSKAYIVEHYKKSFYDLFGAFIERGIEMTTTTGCLGAITSRTGFFLSRMEKWRRSLIFGESKLRVLADLGQGVLDSAMVETAAYVIERRPSSEYPILFYYLVESEDKQKALQGSTSWRTASFSFMVERKNLETLPGAPLAYWSPPELRSLYSRFPSFVSVGGEVKQGLASGDDFRFLRLFWEIPPSHTGKGKHWVVFAKGGEYQRYYYDPELVVDWSKGAQEIYRLRTTQFPVMLTKNAHRYCYRPALTYPQRTQKGFNVRQLPAGSLFGAKGPAIFPPDSEDLWYLLGLYNSDAAEQLIKMLTCFGSYNEGYVSKLPYPNVSKEIHKAVKLSVREIVFGLRSRDSCKEISHVFNSLTSSNVKNQSELNGVRDSLEELIKRAYGISSTKAKDQGSIENAEGNQIMPESEKPNFLNIVSYSVGIVMSRWDVRIALDPSLAPKLPDPFDPLPACPPAMLVCPDGLPAELDCIVSEEWLRARPDANTLPTEGAVKNPTVTDSDYQLRVSWDGILVDDPGFEGGQIHDQDIVLRTREVLYFLWKQKAQDIEQEACDILNVPDLRIYFRNSFFKDHIKRYSKSRRKAPIYWQLSTSSVSYSIWLYYHRFTKDTFYKVLNEYVLPKLKFEERELINIHQQYGASPTAIQRKEITAREAFVTELTTFKEEVGRIAPLWNPNLNDGVIINFALLWRLVPQNKPWQKECKKVWDKLVKGDYDWAHLALKLWPERVVSKCAKDQSLAIAHSLDETFWEKDNKGKGKPRKISKETMDSLIQEYTSPMVKAALEDLLKAPIPANMAGKKRKKKA